MILALENSLCMLSLRKDTEFVDVLSDILDRYKYRIFLSKQWLRLTKRFGNVVHLFTKLLSIYLDSSKLGFLFCHLQIMFKLLMHFHGRQNAKNMCKMRIIELLTVDDDAANVIITPKSNLAQVLEFEALLMLVCSNKILFRNCIHKHKRTIM